MRVASGPWLPMLLLVLLLATFGAACGGPGEEAYRESLEREEEQHAKADPHAADEKADESESAGEQADSAKGEESEAATDDAGDGEAVEAAGGAGEADLAHGKELFVSSCGSCHRLSDAGTEGTVGPALDGTVLTFDEILEQIAEGGNGMPQNIVTGEDAEAVAAYVDSVANK